MGLDTALALTANFFCVDFRGGGLSERPAVTGTILLIDIEPPAPIQ